MSSASIPPPQDNQPDDIIVFRFIFGFIILFLLTLLLLSGCCPKGWSHLHDGVVKHDTTFVTIRDSIHHYERDSIFVKEKGDTIYKYVEKWRYRDRWHIDTLVKVRVDSVAVYSTEVVEVSKPLSAWQKWQIRGFWYLCGAIVLLLAFWIIRKRLKP